MERVLEPELMEDPAQAAAYARADFSDVNQGFVDRFRAMFPGLTRGRAVDLGSGPADIPIRLSRALPRLDIVAVDGSEAMLDEARRALASAESTRVSLIRARVPDLPFPPHAFDAVISNSLLHHLPDPHLFWREVVRLGRPGAPVLVMDLFRPDSPERAREIVDAAAPEEDPILKADFFNSLLAAFTPEEVREQLATDLADLHCRIVSERHWLVSGRLA
ncbi:MAG: methyltransferase domain-containing protein [Candidatus Rokubacteria bacterium]|nr:methyltransferase domain-containing protein [Candidatus Rokubacteria bacterium]